MGADAGGPTIRTDPAVASQTSKHERGRGAGTSTVEHLSRQERRARGKAAREILPRESQAEFAPEARLDPIDLLREQARTRIPELGPIRYGRMSVSPFSFYRGAALIMAADLSTTPSSGLNAQLCGDAHLSNFGMYGSPERRLVFDVNDFDETAVGPWEWDVKRLATSVEIAGRDDGFSDKDRRKAVLASVKGYRNAMRSFADMTNLEAWDSHIDVEQELPEIRKQTDPKRAKELQKAASKARTRDSMEAFTKFTEEVDGKPRIVSRPPLIVPLDELLKGDERDEIEQGLVSILASYRKTLESDRRHLLDGFRFVEIARKVVGVGSVGTQAWIVLMLGVDDQDPLILQAKEADESVLERFVGKSGFANHGHRVVAGQRLMQATSDIFLGWDRITGIGGMRHDYYFRQFRDWKGSVQIDSLRPAGLAIYARLCGWTLARAHARSGDRVAIASYLGKSGAFDHAIAEFSVTYADQNQRDYEALQAAIKHGTVRAKTGV